MKAKEPTFSKEALLKSKRFFYQRDVLHVILMNDKMYTLREVNSLINSFFKKEVK